MTMGGALEEGRASEMGWIVLGATGSYGKSMSSIDLPLSECIATINVLKSTVLARRSSLLLDAPMCTRRSVASVVSAAGDRNGGVAGSRRGATTLRKGFGIRLTYNPK